MKYTLYSWNVNGIRAVARKGFSTWFKKTKPDLLCLQETKAHPKQLDDEITKVSGYEACFSSSQKKKGYSGVVTYARVPDAEMRAGFGVPEFDTEGRTVVTDVGPFVLYNVYFPNGKASPARLKYKMQFYEAFLQHVLAQKKRGKKLIICGDVNTAHKEIDLARPKENQDISGFLPIERAWMDELMAAGFADSFRALHPTQKDAYTWWSMRSGARVRNVGWRIDYFIIDKKLLPRVKKADIHPDVQGSDHCPLSLVLDI